MCFSCVPLLWTCKGTACRMKVPGAARWWDRTRPRVPGSPRSAQPVIQNWHGRNALNLLEWQFSMMDGFSSAETISYIIYIYIISYIDWEKKRTVKPGRGCKGFNKRWHRDEDDNDDSYAAMRWTSVGGKQRPHCEGRQMRSAGNEWRWKQDILRNQNRSVSSPGWSKTVQFCASGS